MKWNTRIAFWVSLGILIVAATLVSLPLFRAGFYVSDDGGWMIIRLSAFYQSFREGQFPVRFLGRLNFSYGYPVANFLYPGFMYIGSLIHFLGISFVDTVKIILGGAVLTASIFSFLWLRVYFGLAASVVGATAFTFAPYLLFDVYRRGSVGEVLALAWAAMGFYAIASRKKWLFGLAVPLLILSHNTLALLFLGLFAVYISVRGAWRDLILMFVVGMGMGAFFWIPALYERKYVMFDSVTVANPREHFISMSTITLLGLTHILAAALTFFRKKILSREKIFFIIVLAITVFLVLPVSSVIWQSPVLTRIIQFPYRLLSVTMFAGVWLTAYVIHTSKRLTRVALSILFMGIGLWTAADVVSSVHHVNEPDGFYTTNEASTTVADEYMPKWASVKPVARAGERLIFYKGRGSFQVNHMSTQTIDVEVAAAEESVIQINTLYYPGWGATVDNTKVRIDYSNAQGVMRISIPAGKHHLVVAFRETISRFLADCLSLASLIMYLVFIVLDRNTSRKKK